MASVSCFITSTRRIWPLTFNVISRSTAPGREPCPMSVDPRNKYADAETAAPLAITILMNARRETVLGSKGDCCWIFIKRLPRQETRTRPPQQEREGRIGRILLQRGSGVNRFVYACPSRCNEATYRDRRAIGVWASGGLYVHCMGAKRRCCGLLAGA